MSHIEQAAMTGRPAAPTPMGVVHQLRAKIRQVETASRINDGSMVTNGCAAIDRLLPERGYPRGTLVQWITGGGHGADFLSLRVAQQACAEGGALVVVDPLNQFFPPAAAAIGINLDNLIVLRTGQLDLSRISNETASHNDLLWAVDQSLRCSAVAAVWGYLTEINERWFRRFQLSAESSGCLGLFVQPPRAGKRPSWAEVQWLVGMNQNAKTSSSHQASNQNSHSRCEPGHEHLQIIRLQLTRCRGTHTGKTLHVAIDAVTGKVQPAPAERHRQIRPDKQVAFKRQAYRKPVKRTG